jgi:hypothetical protein
VWFGMDAQYVPYWEVLPSYTARHRPVHRSGSA